LEYRWREIRPGQLSHNLVLAFQRAQPVHTVRYLIRPLRIAGREVRTHVFNAGAQPPVVSSEAGYTVIQARNLPAARSEPFMPREMAVGTWMFIHYAGAADVTMSEATLGQLREGAGRCDRELAEASWRSRASCGRGHSRRAVGGRESSGTGPVRPAARPPKRGARR
jgi:hypothetical protein